MNCPICNSTQTDTFENIRAGLHWIQCANCDHEGFIGLQAETLSDSIDNPSAYAEALCRERGRRNGRRR